MIIEANSMHFSDLNQKVRQASEQKIIINNCIGQRYIASGLEQKQIELHGTPGNALGAYLNGGEITVFGNAQEATGDTMNDGKIVIHGSSGDATGYAMRGGKIFVRGNTGYRAGIHMKEYHEKIPVIVIGGTAGSFLGEYQAGGRIIVLGLGADGGAPVKNFCGTGMHGGKMFLRGNTPPKNLPKQVCAVKATKADLKEIETDIAEFCALFGEDFEAIISSDFFVLTPDSKNPYQQMYTKN